jgi:hypothetical protein
MTVPLVLVPADGAVGAAVTKMGGQPVWLERPQWPMSRETGKPMQFLGQFALDGDRLAYLFMTDDEDGFVEGTYAPTDGENALIVQPGGRIPDFLTVEQRSEGPTVGPDCVPEAEQGVSGEGNGSGEEGGPGAEGGSGEPDSGDDPPFQFLGGPGVEPHWLQGPEAPGEDWRLLVQLDSAVLPYYVNFGDAGVGYAFLSPEGDEGRFLWQCC